MKKMSNAAIATAIAEAKEELALERGFVRTEGELPLKLISDGHGWPWYEAVIRVPDDESGLNFLVECVDHGHYNQACPASNPRSGCHLVDTGRLTWRNEPVFQEVFDLPTLVVGVASMGDRFVSQEIQQECWVGYDDAEAAGEGEWTFVHDIYVLRPGLPVGAKAVFASATSESEVTLEKVSEEAWEARLLLPSVQYVCASYGAQDADTSPYGGTYFQAFKKAWISHREKIQREAKRECFSALEKSASAPLTWNLGELFRSLA